MFPFTAKAAANATLELPTAQMNIMTIQSDSEHDVLSKYSSQIKEAANKAADEAIQKALEKEQDKNQK